MLQPKHHIVLWGFPGHKIAFEADVNAASQREAVEKFRAMFPADEIRGCYPLHSNGRFR